MSNLRNLRGPCGYDRLAPYYAIIERLVFGQRLQAARLALLDQLPPWRDLLLLGDGDGRLLESLAVHSPMPSSFEPTVSQPRRIVSLDYSGQMLRRQADRLARLDSPPTTEFRHMDAWEFVPQPGEFDALVVPFFLDCFSAYELAVLIPRWLSGLRPGGWLYYVDFHPLAGGWTQPATSVLLRVMHQFFAWQTGLATRRLANPQPMFIQSGLQLVCERTANRGLLLTQLWRAPPASQLAPYS